MPDTMLGTRDREVNNIQFLFLFLISKHNTGIPGLIMNFIARESAYVKIKLNLIFLNKQ